MKCFFVFMIGCENHPVRFSICLPPKEENICSITKIRDFQDLGVLLYAKLVTSNNLSVKKLL